MIDVSHLSKHYGAVRAVDDISFTVPPGRVVGFLGPNGAGKSTAMRAMVGLTRPTSGETRILGRRYVDLPRPGRQVGVLLDAGAQHVGRTGHEVLTLTAMMLGAERSRVPEMLALVGLSPKEAQRRVGAYSLGMRQRLGIANALLGDPTVLILDEPANGLDPQGIHWMRGLLRGFADRGGTVLLSSHLLTEVEQVADDLVLIGRGRVLAQGTKSDLLHAQGSRAYAVDADSLNRLATALHVAGTTTRRADDGGLLIDGPTDLVGRAALEAGVVLTRLTSGESTGLEEMFLSLTADAARDERDAATDHITREGQPA